MAPEPTSADDSAAASDAGGQAEPAAELPMEAVPLMGWLAVATALIDHLGSRLLLRIATAAGVNESDLLSLMRFGGFARNVAALAGLVALGLSLADFIKPRPFIAPRKRIGLAAFAGVFLPTILLATMLPTDRTTAQVVLFAAGAANVLAAMLGTLVLQWRAPWLLRAGLGAAVLMTFLAFGAIVLLLINRSTLWQAAYPIGMIMRRAGEGAYVVALILLALAAWPRGRSPRLQTVAAVVGSLVALIPFLAIVGMRRVVEPELFGNAIYGSLHVEMLLDSMPMLYVAIASATLGLGVAGLFAASAPNRQIAAAVLLLLASGYAPTTPLTLLLMVLGVTLATRSLVAHSTLLALKESSRDLHDLSRELDEAAVE